MRNLLVLLVFCFTTTMAIGQSEMHEYSRVKIDLSNHHISEIAALGLEADHGIYAKGKHLINDFSIFEIEVLRTAGIPFEIQIADVKAHYVERNKRAAEHGHDHERTVVDCEGSTGASYDYDTPANYTYGSMGGYLTYDELLATLDQMTALYPDLISARTPIGTITTHEDRPIYWLRLSDNPNVQEDEPEALYTALHHAREPNSLAQMVFYLWYMLENYATDTEVQYLLDNTQLYFIPCVNPDGYVYNETTDPDGGGLWRKNKYTDDGELFGVDLNRNYGYEWGFDNQGSSPTPTSQTYRGPSAFSEPETQAVRDFCNEHGFQLTLNYHTYGNLLVYPWGYSDQVTDDNDEFTAFADVMTAENNYLAGTGTETVGYTVNGDSDDWMYGETDSKPAIFSMTPEAGPESFGFWPPESAIDELNKSCLLQNMVTAHLLLNYGQAKEVNGETTLSETAGTLDVVTKKYGLMDGTVTTLVTGIEGVTGISPIGINSWSLTHLQEEYTTFEYELNSDLLDGDIVRFLISVDNGEYAWTDTLTKVFSTQETTAIITENGTNLDNWNYNGDWGLSTSEFYSAPSSITDSPDGIYDNNTNSTINLTEPFDLSNALSAKLNYYAKWNIEADWDYVQVLASTSGFGYSALCGIYTNPGVENQLLDQPLYDGVQNDWVYEEVDLADYLGEETVYIRFRFSSDQAVEVDGFYFDDLSVNVVTDPSAIDELDGISGLSVFPNPMSETLRVSFDSSRSFDAIDLHLVDALGKLISTSSLSTNQVGNQTIEIDTQDLLPGVYFVRLMADGYVLSQERVVKVD